MAAHDGLQTEKLILIAGPDQYARVVNFYCDQIGLRPGTRKLFFKEVTKRVGMTPESLQVSNLAQKIGANLMVVHDRGDKAVRFEASENIHRAVAGSKFLITEGLGHRRILKDAAVIAQVAEFIG